MPEAPINSLRRRRFVLGGSGSLILLALLLTGYWQWAAHQIRISLDTWQADQIARGFLVRYDEPEITGFPLTLQLVVDNPALTAPDGRSWQGPRLSGQAALWNPFTIDADISGTHRIRGLEGFGEIDAVAGSAKLTLHLAFNGAIDEAAAVLTDVTLANALIGEASVDRIEAGLGPVRPASESHLQQLDFAGTATGVALPAASSDVLGDLIESVSLHTTIHGPLPAQRAEEAFPIWRDAGGKAVVHGFDISWGPMVLTAKGSATLDRRLRPEGRFATRMTGLNEVLDILSGQGRLEPTQASLLRLLVLSLGGSADGGQVSLPITMKDGVLTAGPVPVARLRPVL